MVLDASAILEVLLKSPAGAAIHQSIFSPRETLHVPHLADLEVTQVVRRYLLSNVLDNVRAGQALDDYQDLPLIRYPHSPFLKRVWELRHNFSAYDAIYIALAEALDAPLLTCDRALASVTGHRAKVLHF